VVVERIYHAVLIISLNRSQKLTAGVLDARDQDRCVTISFNIIIPVQHWLWEKGDEKCRVALQFGHPKLGNWKEDIGEFKLHRLVQTKH
jgi:hypothetical protein